ncbi:MAG: hypothetical protein WC071_13215, partial [Victivallaceae bacterium]
SPCLCLKIFLRPRPERVDGSFSEFYIGSGDGREMFFCLPMSSIPMNLNGNDHCVSCMTV